MTHRCDVHSASSLQENDDFYARTPSATSDGLKLAGLLASLAPTLLDALTEVATYASAEDELARAIAALARSGWEIARNSPPILGKLAVFMPSNNILYSYVLYGLIPSLYSNQVIVRPSSRVHHTTVRVHRILSEACRAMDGPTIALSDAGQRVFSRECRDADLVVFTGRYENSFAISAGLGRYTRLLRFGSGPNPIVIGKGVDLALVVGDVVTARLYNAGQDCLCPDVIFVHSHVHDAFIDGLLERLGGITVGDRRDPDTIVAPLVYADAVERAGLFVTENAERVRFGGRIDIDEGTVEPTVVELPFHAAFHPPELFSPVFCVVQYDDAQIEKWLRSPAELERGMYVSTYGETSLAGATIGTSVVCREHTAFDAEDGNTPFGGFGKRASSVVCDHAFAARPLLISKEARARHQAISSAQPLAP